MAIPGTWEGLREMLAPAFALWTLAEDEIRERLDKGVMRALRLVEGGSGVVVYQVSDKPHGRVLFITYAAGRLDGGPRERIRKMREIERAFEAEARRLGCVEMQGGGRNWHRVLRGWEPDGGDGVSLRKAL